MLLVFLIEAFIHISVREDEYALAIFLVVLELTRVSVATRESNRTVAMHFVLNPVAGIDAALRVASRTMAMFLTVVSVTFVLKYLHLAMDEDGLREGCSRATIKNRFMDLLEASRKFKFAITRVKETLE